MSTAEPNLHDIIYDILYGQKDKTQRQKIADIKTAASVLGFLTEKHTADMAGLTEKVVVMLQEFDGVRDKIKKADGGLAFWTSISGRLRFSKSIKLFMRSISRSKTQNGARQFTPCQPFLRLI